MSLEFLLSLAVGFGVVGGFCVVGAFFLGGWLKGRGQ